MQRLKYLICYSYGWILVNLDCDAIFKIVLGSPFVHCCQFLTNLLGLFGSEFAHFSGHISTNFQYINIHQIDYFGHLTQSTI